MRNSNVVLAIGDTVRMKSGGHEMTVRGFEKTDSTPVSPDHVGAHIRAEWMGEDGKIHAHVFHRDMLEGVKVGREDAPQSGVQNAIERQDARQQQPPRVAQPLPLHQGVGDAGDNAYNAMQHDPRAIPGGIPQNKVAPPPDKLWNEDRPKTEAQKPNADKQGKEFNSPAQQQGAVGGSGSDTH